jgi:hypothetical protein
MCRGKFSFTIDFPHGIISSVENKAELKDRVTGALKRQDPVKGLPGTRISSIEVKPREPFDISFELSSGKSRVRVFGEIKDAFSPKLLEEISPWVNRVKSMRNDVAYAMIAPAFSSQAQAYCIANEIDFLDLAGNIFISVPGQFTVQRTGMRVQEESSSASPRIINVFSGRASRVLRVLLEKPRPWTLSEIAAELDRESQRVSKEILTTEITFNISLGFISKTLRSLEEQLWIRRRDGQMLVPEPRRLLAQWAEKYKERFRWRLRSSFLTSNPYGSDVDTVGQCLRNEFRQLPFAFTGVAAAAARAPYLDAETVDIFLPNAASESELRSLDRRQSRKPRLRFVYPYDSGVFMYSQRSKPVAGVPLVSDIQAYLDLYAQGGRELKQAECLFDKVIQPRWAPA